MKKNRAPHTDVLTLSALGFSVLVALSACSGGGSSSSSSGTTQDAATVSPTKNSTGVSRGTTVTATFSQNMLGTSINTTTFQVVDGSAISGAVSFDGATNVATFTPAKDLTLLRKYTASLASGITNLSGTPITPMTWDFTVGDGTWAAGAKIETDDATAASYPLIAFDPNGNAIAAWIQGNDVYANYYNATSGTWGTAQAIESLSLGAANPIQVALDNNGDGIVVWSHNISGAPNKQTMYANRYTKGIGWGTETPLENNTGNAFYPQIAIDGFGNAMVVWLQPSNAVDSIWANYYDIDTGTWGTATVIETADGVAYAPKIAIDDGGDAIAVWVQNNSTYDAVYAAYYTASGPTWGSAAEIGSDATASTEPDIAVDGDGNAIAVWSQVPTGGSAAKIWYNKYSGMNWGTAAQVESESFNSYSPLVDFDGNGNAMSVWKNNGNIVSSVYKPATGWSAVQSAESQSGSGSFQQFEFDAGGNAIVAWGQNSNSVASIWTNRYQDGVGWGTEQLLETDDTNAANSSAIAIDTSGSAFAVWIQSDGTQSSVWAARFE